MESPLPTPRPGGLKRRNPPDSAPHPARISAPGKDRKTASPAPPRRNSRTTQPNQGTHAETGRTPAHEVQEVPSGLHRPDHAQRRNGSGARRVRGSTLPAVSRSSLPEPADHLEQHDPADDRARGQDPLHGHLAVEKLADGEQRGPDHGATGDPADKSEAYVVARGLHRARGNPGFKADGVPSGPGGLHLFEEGKQGLPVGQRGEEGGEQPAHRSEGNGYDDFDALEGFRATRALDSALCALLVCFIGSVVISATPDPSAP